MNETHPVPNVQDKKKSTLRYSRAIHTARTLLATGCMFLLTSLALAADGPMGDPSDIAAELQAELGLSDDQMAQLAPIMGGSIRSIITIVMENSDKRMSVRQKLQMAKSMKKIKNDTDS